MISRLVGLCQGKRAGEASPAWHSATHDLTICGKSHLAFATCSSPWQLSRFCSTLAYEALFCKWW